MAPLRGDEGFYAHDARLVRIEGKLDHLDEKLDDFRASLAKDYVPRPEYDVRHADLARRVGNLESTVNKLTWAVIGALGTALMEILSRSVKLP